MGALQAGPSGHCGRLGLGLGSCRRLPHALAGLRGTDTRQELLRRPQPFPPSPGAGTLRSRVVPAVSLHFPCCGQAPEGHVLREREKQVQQVPNATVSGPLPSAPLKHVTAADL